MYYANNFCSVSIDIKDNDLYHIFTGKCIHTGKEVSVRVKADELDEIRKGKLIQDALHSNTVDEREFLISGIGPGEFDNFLKEEGI